MDKLRWAITAGDQEPESHDDKKCGDHYIDKDKECHEGDAHRPDPGTNPYWQGGRKGPPSADPSGKGKSEDGSRDRREVTKKAKEKKESRERTEGPSTPDTVKKALVEELTYCKNKNEESFRNTFGEDAVLDWNSPHGQKLQNENTEFALRTVMRERAGEFDTRKEKDYLPGREGDDGTSVSPGSRPRQMWRPEPGSQDITFDPHIKIPPKGHGIYKDMVNLIDWGKPPEKTQEPEHEPEPEGPSPEMEQEQEKWGGEGYKGEEAPSEKGEMPYEFQDRQVDEWDPSQGPEEVKPYQQKERRRQTQKEHKRRKDATKKEDKGAESSVSLAPGLHWSISKIMQDRVDDNYQSPKCGCPDDVSYARPCEEGEDPKKGKCNPNIAPERKKQQYQTRKPEYDTGISVGPQTDTEKSLRKGDPNQGVKPGMGLDPAPDPGREQRMAQHVARLTNDDGSNHAGTAWALGKMFGSSKPKLTADGRYGGGSNVASKEEAVQQNADAKVALTDSGWDPTSDMGNRSTWKKGKTQIVLDLGTKAGNYGNKFQTVGPKPAPKKKGWFK